jgi:MFS family permease
MGANGRVVAITILVIAEMAGMNSWFMANAVLPDMLREVPVGPGVQALLASAVQAGFVVGALTIAGTGVADRYDPRRLFMAAAVAAGACNAMLALVPVAGWEAILLRLLTGICLAGVYPVGMKIAVGWGARNRGLLVGLLVAGLTAGKSGPYLLAWLGGPDWRLAVLASSAVAAVGGLAVLAVDLGPAHAQARQFQIRAIAIAWTDRRIRSAYFGYLGHMWELFAFWAWVAAAATASFAVTTPAAAAEGLGKLTAFLAVFLGAPACIAAGLFADRMGKAEVAIFAMVASALLALLSAFSFGGPVWLTATLLVLWGIAIIPDSAQFSALVADYAPPEISGSLLTLQTALGFTLTIATVQVVPMAADAFGWQAVLAALALGPAFGIVAMLPLRRRREVLAGGA